MIVETALLVFSLMLWIVMASRMRNMSSKEPNLTLLLGGQEVDE